MRTTVWNNLPWRTGRCHFSQSAPILSLRHGQHLGTLAKLLAKVQLQFSSYIPLASNNLGGQSVRFTQGNCPKISTKHFTHYTHPQGSYFACLCHFVKTIATQGQKAKQHHQIINKESNATNHSTYQRYSARTKTSQKLSACSLQQGQGTRQADGLSQMPKAQPLGVWWQP